MSAETFEKRVAAIGVTKTADEWIAKFDALRAEDEIIIEDIAPTAEGLFADVPDSYLQPALYLIDIRERPPMEHIVENFIVAGAYTLITGRPGGGKSTVNKQLVCSLLTGAPFMGASVLQGEVLMFGMDEPLVWTAETLGMMGLPSKYEVEKQLHIYEELPEDKNFDKTLAVALRRHSNARVLMIDTLQNFTDADNINDNSEMHKLLKRVKRVARHYPNLGVFIIHHDNKSGKSMGASTIDGGFDIIYQVAFIEDGLSSLICTKSRVIKKPKDAVLRFCADTHTYTRVDATELTQIQGDSLRTKLASRTADKQAAAQRFKILELIRSADDPVSFKELMAETQLSKSPLHEHLRLLKESGDIVSVGKGLYRAVVTAVQSCDPVTL